MKNIGRILVLMLLLANFNVVKPASASIPGASNDEVQLQSVSDLDLLQKRESLKSLQTQSKSSSDDTNKKLFDQKSNLQSLPQVPSQQNVTSGSSIGLSKLQGIVPDIWETEPNDTEGTANVIALDAKVLGNFDSYADFDDYEIFIPQDGTLKIMGMAGDDSGSYSPYFTFGVYYKGNSLDWTNSFTEQGTQVQYMEVDVSGGCYYYIHGMTWDPIAQTHSSKIVGKTYRFMAYLDSTDTTPPAVVARDYYNASSVPIEADFSITYDEAIKIVDPSKIYFYEWNTYKVLKATAVVKGTKLSITPVTNFLSQTKYMINIDKGAISDSSGNIPEEDYYYSFTTGSGTLTLPDGSVYVGEIANNQPNGQGTRTWTDGTKYVGQFVDGEASGQGTMTWTSGEKYVGEYQNDARNGQGTYTWPNGDKYIGEYQNGARNGQGTYTFADGTILTGLWQEDVFMSSTVNVTSVSLDKKNLSLPIGSTETLTATIYPLDACNQEILSWTNTDDSVVKVNYDWTQNYATIEAIGPGRSIITVTTADGGFTDQCIVDVKNYDDVFVTSVSLNKRNLTLTVGMTEKLQATIMPTDATNQALAWVSNNNAVATVDETGVVKAIGPGQARITLISADGGKTDYCDVEVKNKVSLQAGDANGDGKVTIMDAVKIARSLVGLETLTSSQKLAADFNGDGKVTIMDAQGIAKYLVISK